MRTTRLVILTAALGVIGGGNNAQADDWFQPASSVAEYRPKGPSHCFRQFNIDWSWIRNRPEQITEFLSQADPAAFAAFCQEIHLDGTIVMAVPHHGYCSYETKVGTKFPGMRGDWFGETIAELHKRKIAAFGYVTLNWNWKYIRDHEGAPFIHAKRKPDGSFDTGYICLNAPGYLDLVESYTREVLERYPVDGMRWDILATARGCTCAGCKAFYQELHGEPLESWSQVDWRRQEDFYLATTGCAATRLQAICKRIKPSVEIWQNSIQTYAPNLLDLGRLYDIAYNEYGDPFRLLLLKGVMNKGAAINGLMNQAPVGADLDRRAFRLCLALGGRCYSYYGHKLTDPRTVMPGAAMLPWHRQQLAPFYTMVSEIQPWLEGVRPVAPVGVVYSENTRFRYPKYDRAPYVAALQKITESCLERSLPLEFLNRLDLTDPQKPLESFSLLILPLTSGLRSEELDSLLHYVRGGGCLLIAGEALRHGEKGEEQPDFALASEMGLHFEKAVTAQEDLPCEVLRPRKACRLRPRSGNMSASVPRREKRAWWSGIRATSWPLWHEQSLGAGRVVFLASLDSLALTQAVIDARGGPRPVTVTPAEKNPVILTRLTEARRWVLHLIADGDYTVQLHRDRAPVTRVVEHYPPTGWEYRAEPAATGLRLIIRGGAQDRLLVLE